MFVKTISFYRLQIFNFVSKFFRRIVVNFFSHVLIIFLRNIVCVTMFSNVVKFLFDNSSINMISILATLFVFLCRCWQRQYFWICFTKLINQYHLSTRFHNSSVWTNYWLNSNFFRYLISKLYSLKKNVYLICRQFNVVVNIKYFKLL